MHRSTICDNLMPSTVTDRSSTTAMPRWNGQHCNSPEHRGTLRHHGAVLTGPSPDDFAEVPSVLLRERMRSQVPDFMGELAT